MRQLALGREARAAASKEFARAFNPLNKKIVHRTKGIFAAFIPEADTIVIRGRLPRKLFGNDYEVGMVRAYLVLNIVVDTTCANTDRITFIEVVLQHINGVIHRRYLANKGKCL